MSLSAVYEFTVGETLSLSAVYEFTVGETLSLSPVYEFAADLQTNSISAEYEFTVDYLEVILLGINQTSGQLVPLRTGDVLRFTNGQAILGTTGIQGAIPQGIAGLQGITGIVGSTGLQPDFAGTTGLIGFVGNSPQGATGIEFGPTGIRGITGVIGITGLLGITGLSPTGLQGIQGQTGPVIGATGLRGITGLAPTIIGITGVSLDGLQGIQGATGILGAASAQTLDVQRQISGTSISYLIPPNTLAVDEDQLEFVCWATGNAGATTVSLGGTQIFSTPASTDTDIFLHGYLIRVSSASQEIMINYVDKSKTVVSRSTGSLSMGGSINLEIDRENGTVYTLIVRKLVQ